MNHGLLTLGNVFFVELKVLPTSSGGVTCQLRLDRESVSESKYVYLEAQRDPTRALLSPIHKVLGPHDSVAARPSRAGNTERFARHVLLLISFA